MYRVELKGTLAGLSEAQTDTFLMYRVELKVYQSKYSTTSWNEIVPNVPCGVESEASQFRSFNPSRS